MDKTLISISTRMFADDFPYNPLTNRKIGLNYKQSSAHTSNDTQRITILIAIIFSPTLLGGIHQV